MMLIRVLAIALVALSVSLSGGIATGHGVKIEVTAEMPDDHMPEIPHAACCDEGIDHAPTCQISAGIVPSDQRHPAGPQGLAVPAVGASNLPDGMKPELPLVPPRRA